MRPTRHLKECETVVAEVDLPGRAGFDSLVSRLLRLGYEMRGNPIFLNGERKLTGVVTMITAKRPQAGKRKQAVPDQFQKP